MWCQLQLKRVGDWVQGSVKNACAPLVTYQVPHDICMIALLEHLNLFLDLQHFIFVAQRYDLHCNYLLRAPDLCLVHRPI